MAVVLPLGAALVAILVKVAFAQELRRLAVHETVEISRCEDFAAAAKAVPAKSIASFAAEAACSAAGASVKQAGRVSSFLNSSRSAAC
jgi:hypothetical protein